MWDSPWTWSGCCIDHCRVAKVAERETVNFLVVGSSPTSTAMVPEILMRIPSDFDGEYEKERQAAISAGFDVRINRCLITSKSLVIGRYSVLPFYKELEEDLAVSGSRLINSFHEHCFAAQMDNWVSALGDLTPETWYRLEDVPEHAQVVVKGETNSRKFEWDTMMFASDRRAAGEVASRLVRDPIIGSQRICFRRYVPLKRLATGLNGLPITEEFRVFVLNGTPLCSAFYWSSHIGDLDVLPQSNTIPPNFLKKVTDRMGLNIPFYAVDVARTEYGDWIVIEINDGQMSGLSMNDPFQLYSNILNILTPKEMP